MIPDELPPGNWRLDPFARAVRYVYDNPDERPDAFDETRGLVSEDRGGRPVKPIDHGTYRGARAHYRRDERLCKACRVAEYEYSVARARRRHAEGDPKFTCACGAFKAKRTSQRCPQCATAHRNTQDRKAA